MTQINHKVVIFNPTPTSHWLIPQQLICGGYPHKKYLDDILSCGVNVFICLQDEKQLKRKNLFDYRKEFENRDDIECYQFPIIDGSVACDRKVFRWCHMILDLLYRGKTIYMHCLGGHGRAGTISSCLLQILDDNFKASDALEFNNKAHSTRLLGKDVRTPQTDKQIYQVSRFEKLTPLVFVTGSEKWNDVDVMEREIKRFQKGTIFLTNGYFPNFNEVAKRLGYKPIIYKSKRKVFGSTQCGVQMDYLLEDNDLWLALIFDKDIENSNEILQVAKKCENKGLYTRLIVD